MKQKNLQRWIERDVLGSLFGEEELGGVIGATLDGVRIRTNVRSGAMRTGDPNGTGGQNHNQVMRLR